MFTFPPVVHAIIAAALVTVILMQKSEGGGLGMGGSPSGLMSARGAADFLTRMTSILANGVRLHVDRARLHRGAPPDADDRHLARPSSASRGAGSGGPAARTGAGCGAECACR